MTDGLTHFDEAGSTRMVDVGAKPFTSRRAVAEGRVRISRALADAIEARTLTKGNLIETARLAGIQAAKRTAELIPLCHPLPLDAVDVTVRLRGEVVEIRAEVRTVWKTGVEMEALTAVSVAALTVIDMGKAVDRTMVIESIRLVEKSGGVHGNRGTAAGERTETPIRAAVLTVSDRCSRGEAADTSGPALVQVLQSRLGAEITTAACIPDEREQIASLLRRWANDEPPPDLILTTGGTGLSARDVTPEATRDVVERRHEGLTELIRLRCYAKTPRAYLSRGEAGVIGSTLVINLPGSRTGAVESLEALLDILPHAVKTLRGEATDHSAREPPRAPGDEDSRPV
ncbi:bifunctional molybdenum cofactor biosynthesis protein MoaC/MoaB [Thermopirellula anaerolimosa]